MKKYTLSVISLSLILITVLSIMDSYSWFTARVTSIGNTFSTGKLSIKCPDSPVIYDIASINCIYPGWQQSGCFKIENDGSLDFDYGMHIEKDNLMGNPLFDGASPIQLRVEKNGMLVKDYADLNKIGHIELGTIMRGGSDDLKLYFRLPESAGNDCQGKSADISFIFEARQRYMPYRNEDESIPESGEILYVGYDKEYKTIREAIEAAHDNATIMVSKGIYSEDIVINKPLKLIGRQESHRPYDIDGGDIKELSGGEPELYVQGKNAITLSGKGRSNVVIKGFRIMSPNGAGIVSDGDLKDVIIENNVFDNNKNSCIYLPHVKKENVTIKYNEFTCPKTSGIYAIALDNSQANTNINTVICGNLIKGSGVSGNIDRGITLYGGKDVYISDNLFYNINRLALQVMCSKNVICSYNHVKDSFYGFQFLSSGGYKMDDIRINNNKFEGISGRAININKYEGSAAGGFGNIDVGGNTMNLNVNAFTSNETIPVYIYLDPDYNDHGAVSIKGNIIKLSGVLDSNNHVYAVMLSGKLSEAIIEGNTFDASAVTSHKSPDCAVCIGGNGVNVPESATIKTNNNIFRGFDCEVLDSRTQ